MSAKPEQKRTKRPQTIKNVRMVNGKLMCQRCANSWDVVDLNPERKVVACPVCSEPNDIRKAIDLARGGVKYVNNSGTGK